MSLYVTVHYRYPHTFPHSRITTRVSTARETYRCEREGTLPRDHVELIARGDEYVYLQLHPAKGRGRSNGWTRVRLCPGCAIDYGLASPFEIPKVTAPREARVGVPAKQFRSKARA